MLLPTDPERSPLLFDPGLLELARTHGPESHLRWLALDDDPEAMDMRRVLEHCYGLAGASREALRKGLLHERWGQHSGAIAHLLALGLLAREGFAVRCEPVFGRQSPDVLAEREGRRLVAEVRAITGRGDRPWRAGRERIGARGYGLAPQGLDAPTDELVDTVARVLARKVDAYRELVQRERLPYLLCLYQDTDTQIGGIVRDLAFGRGERALDARGTWRPAHDPRGGLLGIERERFACLSAVLTFGRQDSDEGDMRVLGEVVHNPFAAQPLGGPLRFPDLLEYRQNPRLAPPRMGWLNVEAGALEIAPHP